MPAELEEDILKALRDRWGLEAAIDAIGHAYSSDVRLFRADTENASYFVKFARKMFSPGLSVARLVRKSGVPVAAPVLSLSGSLPEALGYGELAVFPFYCGETMCPEAWLEEDWRTFGASVRGIHRTPLPADLCGTLPHETFEPWSVELLTRVDAALRCAPIRETQEAFAALWQRDGHLLSEFFELVRESGHRATASSSPCCLCHGDLQRDNVLRKAPGEVIILDWESCAWAPAEKDLMFIPPERWLAFQKGYGEYEVDKAVLEYLRADWLLQESLDCVQRILFKAEADRAEKEWAFQMFSGLLRRMVAFDKSHPPVLL